MGNLSCTCGEKPIIKDEDKCADKRWIIVDDEFEVSNGLSGLQRDIVLRLCNLYFEKDEIRKVIGMCGEHCEWKKHKSFRNSRLIRVLLPIALKSGASYDSANARIVHFRTKAVTISVVQNFLNGKIYVIDFLSRNTTKFGFAKTALFPALYSQSFFLNNGTCGFVQDGIAWAGPIDVWPHPSVMDTTHPFWSADTLVKISLELDVASNADRDHPSWTKAFARAYADDILLKRGFQGIPPLGVCCVFGSAEKDGTKAGVVEMKSVRVVTKLKVPHACSTFNWWRD